MSDEETEEEEEEEEEDDDEGEEEEEEKPKKARPAKTLRRPAASKKETAKSFEDPRMAEVLTREHAIGKTRGAFTSSAYCRAKRLFRDGKMHKMAYAAAAKIWDALRAKDKKFYKKPPPPPKKKKKMKVHKK